MLVTEYLEVIDNFFQNSILRAVSTRINLQMRKINFFLNFLKKSLEIFSNSKLDFPSSITSRTTKLVETSSKYPKNRFPVA